MEFTIAAALAAMVGFVVYVVYQRSKSARPTSPEFVCRECGERHCQCERQS